MAAGAVEVQQFAFISSSDTAKRKYKIMRRHLNEANKRTKSRAPAEVTSSDYNYISCHPLTQSPNDATEKQAIKSPPNVVVSTTGVRASKIPREPSGTALLDPFLALPQILPANATSELIQHSVVMCFEGIRPSPPRLIGTTEASAWLSAAIHSPGFFSAILFGASHHLNESLDDNVPYHRLQTTLALKAAVIQQLSAEISLPPAEIKDTTLATIWILSGHNALFEPYIDRNGILLQPSRPASRFQLPSRRILTTLQRIDLLGESPFLSHHVDALVKIVSTRGGLESLKLAALPELVSAADVVLSTLKHSPPGLPLPPCSPSNLGYRNMKPISISPSPSLEHDALPTSFPQELLDLTREIAHYTDFLDFYVTSQIVHPNLSALADWRNRIQHGLLSFSDNGPVSTSTTKSSMALAQIFHSALLMYSHLVVFPLPESTSASLLPAYLNDFNHACRSRSTSTVPLTPTLSEQRVLMWSFTIACIIATVFMDSEPKTYHRLLKAARRMCSIARIARYTDFHSCLTSVLWFPHSLDTAASQLWREMDAGSMPRPQYSTYVSENQQS